MKVADVILLLYGKFLVSKVVLIVDFLKPGLYGALKNKRLEARRTSENRRANMNK